MSLSEFLLARIAEDEEWAVREHLWLGGNKPWSLFEAGLDTPGGIGVDPRRLRAECEAKRRRIELLSKWDASCPPDDWPHDGDMGMVPLSDAGRHLLRIEALPYADHPDFREEWRP